MIAFMTGGTRCRDTGILGIPEPQPIRMVQQRCGTLRRSCCPVLMLLFELELELQTCLGFGGGGEQVLYGQDLKVGCGSRWDLLGVYVAERVTIDRDFV